MNKSLARIPIGELVENPSRVLDRVVRGRKPVVVERRGKVLVLLTPMRSRGTVRRKMRTADRRAFLAAAGSWKDIDTDKFVVANYSSRKRSSRPIVQL
jgi:antitoxin (DNA-binding transcriptional repressor) of toxin-antitoxin stability system